MSTGVGSDSQKPFAIVIVGGLASRLLLSVFLAPVLYSLFARDGDVLRVDVAHAERLHDAAVAQVFSDVDSAYVALVSASNLLRTYKEKYLATSTRVRDTVSYSYLHGAAALVDFLDAQRDYRAVQVAYLNLTGAYLTAVGQLNFAVGREAIEY